jgi:zinc/manganese transport system ATP-binding protein
MPTFISLVDVDRVCFAYGAADVLRDVSVRFLPGQITAIAGPNGSGKSTLVEVIAGVRPPRRGRVSTRGDLALVVQRPGVSDQVPLTVRDAVSIGTWSRGARLRRGSRRRAVDLALERVDMAEHAEDPMHALSGGQRQRVFLAQGIVRRPDVLVLDEPAAGLDRRSAARTGDILAEEAARGAVVICVTHDDDALSHADRVVRLDGGVVL